MIFGGVGESVANTTVCSTKVDHNNRIPFGDICCRHTVLESSGKLWNKIPSYITDLPKKAFQRVLRILLFDILEKEDDYIQIPMIIKKVDT